MDGLRSHKHKLGDELLRVWVTPEPTTPFPLLSQLRHSVTARVNNFGNAVVTGALAFRPL